MRKINLKSRDLASSSAYKQSSGLWSVIVGSIILLITVSLYGVVFYLSKKETTTKEVLIDHIDKTKRELNKNKDFQEVYDFQKRLLGLNNILEKKIIQINILNAISENTLPDAVLTDIKIGENSKLLRVMHSTGENDKKIANVSIEAKFVDLAKVAEQLDAYNDIDINREASLSQGGIDEDGKIKADMEFLINGTSKSSGIKE